MACAEGVLVPCVYQFHHPGGGDGVADEESGGGGRNRTGVHGFAGRCMTTLPPRQSLMRKGKARLRLQPSLAYSGAGNESRTRDLNLGKVALYQLSYSRAFVKGRIISPRYPPAQPRLIRARRRRARPCAGNRTSRSPSARPPPLLVRCGCP